MFYFKNATCPLCGQAVQCFGKPYCESGPYKTYACGCGYTITVVSDIYESVREKRDDAVEQVLNPRCWMVMIKPLWNNVSVGMRIQYIGSMANSEGICFERDGLVYVLHDVANWRKYFRVVKGE